MGWEHLHLMTNVYKWACQANCEAFVASRKISVAILVVVMSRFSTWI